MFQFPFQHWNLLTFASTDMQTRSQKASAVSGITSVQFPWTRWWPSTVRHVLGREAASHYSLGNTLSIEPQNPAVQCKQPTLYPPGATISYIWILFSPAYIPKSWVNSWDFCNIEINKWECGFGRGRLFKWNYPSSPGLWCYKERPFFHSMELMQKTPQNHPILLSWVPQR